MDTRKSQANIPLRRFAAGFLLAALILLTAAGPALALRGQLNVNSATRDQLMRLPFVGEARADAIIDLRRQGPLTDITELLRSPAIGPSTFEAIAPYLKLSGSSSLTDGTPVRDLPLSPTAEKERLAALHVAPQLATHPGEVRLLPDEQYFDILVNHIRKARQRIEVAMFLFKTTRSPDNRARRLEEELIKARRRGVFIQVVLEKSGYDDSLNRENQKTAEQLKRNRIEVAFDSPDTTTHTKLVIIDRRYAFIGSHNFTHSALARNHEVSLLIDNRQVAAELGRYLAGLTD